MKKILFLICLTSVINFKSFSQCEVKSFKIDEDYTRFSMYEMFYRNEDLENGYKSVYIYANAFKDKYNKTLLNSLVVTYIYSPLQPAFTAGKLTIYFSDGSNLTLIANEKSTNTLNNMPKSKNINTIEGIFMLTDTDIEKLVSLSISSFYIADIREETQLEITPKYKRLLIEMFNCVNN